MQITPYGCNYLLIDGRPKSAIDFYKKHGAANHVFLTFEITGDLFNLFRIVSRSSLYSTEHGEGILVSGTLKQWIDLLVAEKRDLVFVEKMHCLLVELGFSSAFTHTAIQRFRSKKGYFLRLKV